MELINLILNLLKSMRISNWSKNLLIFASLIFSHNLVNVTLAIKTIFAFVVFCVLTSGIYLVNDLIFLEQDKQHPIKRNRPIAAGKLSTAFAGRVAIVFIIISIIFSYLLEFNFLLVCLAYTIIMLFYSFHLKKIAFLDVIIIAFGFVLRAIAGAVVINVEVSLWLLVCTFFVASFLVLSKRRHEMVLLGDEANNHRHCLSEYNPQLLDQMNVIMAAATILAYSFYTIAPRTKDVVGTTCLFLTIPFVIYGVFRYLYLVYQKNEGGNPEIVIFRDKPLVINLMLWIGAVVLILY